MAQDLRPAFNGKVRVVGDETLLQSVAQCNLILIGCDCLMSDSIVHKIGTNSLAEAARLHQVPVWCCADRFKQWNDLFPPPLEDIFESFPIGLVDKIVM